MDILGAIFFILLPHMAGYSCKRILRWKETNQIETYLIGFFFLFFVQGVVLIPAVWMNRSLTEVSTVLGILLLGIVLLSGLLRIFQWLQTKKQNLKQPEKSTKTPWKKTERVYFICMVAVFGLILFRMGLGINGLRTDVMLETVLTTIQSGELFRVHPLTGRIMETGMIASKKIVTLPLFYACVAKITGLEAETLLYLVVGTVVLVCSYYALALVLSKMTTITREKLYLAWLVYGLMILSGDYHQNTLAYRLLYNGYDGSTICFGIILPYLLYIIVSWYKQESKEENTTWAIRSMYLVKGMLPLAVSVVITGLGTGFVFLFMAIVLAGICCLLKSIKEVRACKES